MINLIIDGKKIAVPKASTVLNAAKKLNIDIPTLCYHEALPPDGQCRICIVEMSIEKRGRKYNWIDAACVYPVEQGLVVDTNSKRVKKQRKLIIELMLSRAPNSEILKKLALRYGAKIDRFTSIDKGESNCILCGLCVRVCNELVKTGGIGMAYRGINKKVVTPFKIASSICIGCTSCANVCPTGAIKVIEDNKKTNIKNWGVKLELQKCSNCGNPFAPVIHINELKEKTKVDTTILNRCPGCRRKLTRLIKS